MEEEGIEREERDGREGGQEAEAERIRAERGGRERSEAGKSKREKPREKGLVTR